MVYCLPPTVYRGSRIVDPAQTYPYPSYPYISSHISPRSPTPIRPRIVHGARDHRKHSPPKETNTDASHMSGSTRTNSRGVGLQMAYPRPSHPDAGRSSPTRVEGKGTGKNPPGCDAQSLQHDPAQHDRPGHKTHAHPRTRRSGGAGSGSAAAATARQTSTAGAAWRSGGDRVSSDVVQGIGHVPPRDRVARVLSKHTRLTHTIQAVSKESRDRLYHSQQQHGKHRPLRSYSGGTTGGHQDVVREWA